MRRESRAIALVLASLALVASCERDPGDGARVAVPGAPGKSKTAALLRAERRLYDGAPPVVPHGPFGTPCASCHTTEGVAVEGVGFAPPSPHELTKGMSATSRCEQCHPFAVADDVFAENEFEGLRQDLRKGRRLNPLAPPVMPHGTLMRENCAACHTGPAAREEIRCPHPERARCRQCHVPAVTDDEFVR